MDKKTTDEAIAYIRKIANETHQRKIQVTLHGGEPLAAGYALIEQIVTQLKNEFVDIEISIQSNLWLLSDAYCRLFAKHAVRVGTSLDGPQVINDRQRGAGYFDKTLAGIKLARSYGLEIGTIATFTKDSGSYWDEVFEFFLNNNLHFGFHASLSSPNDEANLTLSQPEYVLVFKKLLEKYLKHTHNIKVSTIDTVCKGVALNYGHECTYSDCFGMFLVIDPHGDIFSCQRFAGNRQYALGNISGNPSFDELTQTEMAQKLIKREQFIRESCGECEHYAYCKGGCAFNALMSNGEFNSLDPLCDAYQQIFSHVKEKFFLEVVSEENIEAIDKLGLSDGVNPLFVKGKIIDLVNQDTHPYDMARSAKRIVAAYELGKSKDKNAAARQLVSLGVSKTEESALRSLNKMIRQIEFRDNLIKLYLHITWNCQLHCQHCYAAAGQDRGFSDMNVTAIQKIVQDAYHCGFSEVVITGGEPLMHAEIKKLLTSLSGIRQEYRAINLVLRTNLTFPLALEDWISLTNAFSKIVISIDGDQDHHNQRRGKHSYETIIKNLAFFNENKKEILSRTKDKSICRLALASALRSEELRSELAQHVRELASQYNIDEVTIRPILPIGRAPLAMGAFDVPALETYLPAYKAMRNGFYPQNTCGIGEELYIEPSGDVYPCYAYHKPHALIGNVVEMGLSQILSSEKFRAFKKHSVDTNEGCKDCEYRYLCGGACRAWEGEAAQYNLDAAPQNCGPQKKRARLIHEAALDYLQDLHIIVAS